jgi:hypothetical protein
MTAQIASGHKDDDILHTEWSSCFLNAFSFIKKHNKELLIWVIFAFETIAEIKKSFSNLYIGME